MLQTEGQGSGISLDSIVPNAYQPSGHDYLLLFPFLAIFCSLVCLKQPHGMIRRTAASCQRLWQTMPNLRMNPQSVNIETVQSDSEQTQYSTGVANQSTSGLRRIRQILPTPTHSRLVFSISCIYDSESSPLRRGKFLRARGPLFTCFSALEAGQSLVWRFIFVVWIA